MFGLLNFIGISRNRSKSNTWAPPRCANLTDNIFLCVDFVAYKIDVLQVDDETPITSGLDNIIFFGDYSSSRMWLEANCLELH